MHRSHYQCTTNSCTESIQEAFATIAYRHLHDFDIRTSAPDTLRCCPIGLLRTQTAFE